MNVAEWRVKGGWWQEKRPKIQAGDTSDRVFVRKAKVLSFILLLAVGNQGICTST